MSPYSHADIIPLHVYAAIRHGHVTEQLFKGIQKYIEHPHRSEHYWPSTPLWKYNSAELYHYPVCTQSSVKGRLFIVPSLINGAEIFDLTEEYSFISYLRGQGLEVYLLNWGNLATSSDLSLRKFSENILEKSYIAAYNHAQHPLHIVGHCLGGSILLSSVLPRKYKSMLRSLTLLATPLDFHASKAPWNKYLPHLKSIEKIIQIDGKLSQTMMQSFFGQISPDAVIEKYISFLDWGEASLKSRLFVKVEDWLNGGSDLPPKLALDIFDQFFAQNKVGDFPGCPVHILTSHIDKVVPACVAAPTRMLKGCDNIIVSYAKTGHLGMMASARAKSAVWQPVFNYVSSIENTALHQH